AVRCRRLSERRAERSAAARHARCHPMTSRPPVTAAGGARDTSAIAARIAALLESRGIDVAGVELVGHEADVAAIAAPGSARQAIAAVSAEIKALGVRYVAIEPARATPPAGGHGGNGGRNT